MGGCPLEAVKTKSICIYVFKGCISINFSRNMTQTRVANTATKKTRAGTYVGIYEEKQHTGRTCLFFVSPPHILSQVITQPLPCLTSVARAQLSTSFYSLWLCSSHSVIYLISLFLVLESHFLLRGQKSDIT